MFVKKASESSLATYKSHASTKTSDSERFDVSSKSNLNARPNTSDKTKPAPRPKYSRPPSPPSMYSSFMFEGPIKKPPPLPLGPKKGATSIKVKPRDGDAKPSESKARRKGVRPVPDEISPAILNTRSSIVSCASTSSASTIYFAYPPRDELEPASTPAPSLDKILVDLVPDPSLDPNAVHSAQAQESCQPATANVCQIEIALEHSNSDNYPKTPLTPTHGISTSQLRQRNLEKLTRTLGENVPAELVFKEAHKLEAKAARGTEAVDWPLLLNERDEEDNVSPVSVRSWDITDDNAPVVSKQDTGPKPVLPALNVDEGTLKKIDKEALRLTRELRPSISAGHPSSEELTMKNPVESYHVRCMIDHTPFVTAMAQSKVVAKSSSTSVRAKTSHGSPTSPPSFVPFVSYQEESNINAPPAPPDPEFVTSLGVQRVEQKESWSGEWNQNRMQDVIQKLRQLK